MEYPHLRRALTEAPSVWLGGRALLMMVAHPQISSAVNKHSTYARAPFIRLWETLSLVVGLTSGSKEDRDIAVRYISRKHNNIVGGVGKLVPLPNTKPPYVVEEVVKRNVSIDIAPFPSAAPTSLTKPAGPPAYDANHEAAQLYVWGCLVENTELAYKLFCLESQQPDKLRLEQIYLDWARWAVAFGIPAKIVPDNREQFYAYMKAANNQLASLGMTDDIRDVVNTLNNIRPPWYLFVLQPAFLLWKRIVHETMDLGETDSHKISAMIRSDSQTTFQPKRQTKSWALWMLRVLWSCCPLLFKRLWTRIMIRLMLPLTNFKV